MGCLLLLAVDGEGVLGCYTAYLLLLAVNGERLVPLSCWM